MKKDLKAALLTAVVYPGAGHFSLKKHLIGSIFAGVFSILLILTLRDIFAIAQCTANELVSGKIPMTIVGILKAAQQPSDECAKLAQYKYVPLMVIVWALSIVDAYRLGRKAHIK
ncbi:hypothetical protein Q4596_15385 [Pseudoalteromonas carrageenovora]|uniref:hypothetical protein n=1 Tax=Pseudoalteromonas carrageenovora TaxID=227 RepID=UPI0026E1DBF5|nr:hypothetical protein [Pseudoalteromonas carrageenovora]MDO6837016.1 hypothetical protein [Pseudoalteromonas carrageenovora]